MSPSPALPIPARLLVPCLTPTPTHPTTNLSQVPGSSSPNLRYFSRTLIESLLLSLPFSFYILLLYIFDTCYISSSFPYTILPHLILYGSTSDAQEKTADRSEKLWSFQFFRPVPFRHLERSLLAIYRCLLFLVFYALLATLRVFITCIFADCLLYYRSYIDFTSNAT